MGRMGSRNVAGRGENSNVKKQRSASRNTILLASMLVIMVGFNIYANSRNISDFFSSDKQPPTLHAHTPYIPSATEKYIIDHANELGYNSQETHSSGCVIWKDANATSPEIYKGLQSYAEDLAAYNAAIKDFEPIPDLLKSIKKTGNHDVCSTARPHPDGIEALFPSQQLSSSKSGFVEPLIPPLRDHRFCFNRRMIMSMEYLVHDFEAMCRALKPTSKRILIDMGASLDFHGGNQSIVTLLEQFEKFGFVFDHIYGFEITQSPGPVVYEKLPEKYMTAYHWINVGVSSEEGNKFNPLESILKKFDEDDLILVKLDIDTSSIEVPLANQLLEDKDGIYSKLVDQFYFEHHVKLAELKPYWGRSASGSVKGSLDLFYGLRQNGIPAHSWP